MVTSEYLLLMAGMYIIVWCALHLMAPSPAKMDKEEFMPMTIVHLHLLGFHRVILLLVTSPYHLTHPPQRPSSKQVQRLSTRMSVGQLVID